MGERELQATRLVETARNPNVLPIEETMTVKTSLPPGKYMYVGTVGPPGYATVAGGQLVTYNLGKGHRANVLHREDGSSELDHPARFTIKRTHTPDGFTVIQFVELP